MNALVTLAVWGIAQVSAVSLLAIACYAVVRRRGPAVRSHVAATSLGVTLLVAALAVSPWPRWFSVGPNRSIAAARVEGLEAASVESTTLQAGSTSDAEAASALKLSKKAPNTVDVAATFWQTMLQELASAPVDQPDHASFSWPTVVALALAVAVLLGVFRLAAGLWGVRQLRRSSRPIADRPLLAEVEQLRLAMGCAQQIEVRSSSRLASPVTVGWRRAFILLPVDWDCWNEAELRTALAHELAHIARGDYAAGLLAQLCVAANYYHPLVHWLARRLRLEQELAADAVAATVIGSRGEYLMTLAQLALRCDDRPVAWAARPFLPGRGALSRRIDMLRDARQVFTRPLSGATKAAIVAALVCVGVFAAGVRGPEGSAGSAVAAEPPGKLGLTANGTIASKVAFDLSQIPRDSKVIMALRPAHLLRNERLKPIADMINKTGEFQENFGFPIESVEQVVIASSMSVDQKTPQSGPALMTSVIHAERPIDPAKVRLRSGAPGKPDFEEVAGKKLYVGHEASDLGYFFADEMTMVVGDTAKLRAWLQSGEKKNWAPAGWQELAGSDAALWMDVKAMRADIAKVSQTSAAAMAASFSVLWEETDSLVASATLGDTLKARATAKCTNTETAEKVLKTLEALITLAANSADALKNQPDAEVRPTETTLITSGAKLISQIKLSRKDATVEGTLDAPLDALKMFAAVPPAVNTARDAARRAQSINNMKQLALAMHNYAAAYNHLPPAVLTGPDGKTKYSWRVALLPFLDQNNLYNQYKRDEPWDSENNKKVLAKMPALFRCPSDNPKSLNTSYFAVVGRQTLYHDDTGTAFKQVTDGLSNTILFVDAKRDIPWTKPEDIEVPADKPLPKFGGWFDKSVLVAIADGSVRAIPDTTKEDLLRALLSRAGGEVVTTADLNK